MYVFLIDLVNDVDISLYIVFNISFCGWSYAKWLWIHEIRTLKQIDFVTQSLYDVSFVTYAMDQHLIPKRKQGV